VKTGCSVFIAVFVAMACSWSGFVLGPIRQLGTEGQTNILNASELYPNQRTGDATLGLQVYRAYGCAQCHTTQVGQEGVICDVVLTGAGKNAAAVSNLVSTLKLTGLAKDQADVVSGQITAAGGKTETHIFATGADISRGWGMRHSVAEDFLWDNPVQLGGVRVGPDLSNVGMRYDANWELVHLYNPKAMVKDSIMPPFRFLFTKEKIEGARSPDALTLQGELAPPAGYEIVPTDDAKKLVAYLLSLRVNVPLYDAPYSTLAPAAEKKK
jgi:cbb3-type cytochrome oxidase cytochrome c subunit